MLKLYITILMGVLPLTSWAIDRYAEPGTLQQTINAAQPGDRVVLRDGTYKGNYDTARDGTEAEPIVIESENKWGASIIATGANTHLIDIRHSWITVRYLQFDGVVSKYNEQNAIRIRGHGRITEGVIVEKNVMTGCNAACLHAQDTRRAVIRFNTIDGTGIYSNVVYPGEVFYISKAGGGLAGKEILIYGNQILDANGECFDLKEDSDTIDIHHNICSSTQKDGRNDPRVITGLFSNQGASNVILTDNIFRDYNTTPPSWTGAFMFFGGSSDVDIGFNVVRDGIHGKVTASPGGSLSRIQIHDNTFCNLNNYDTASAVERGDVTFTNNAGYHPGSGASAEVCDAETQRIEDEIALLPDSEFIRGATGSLEDAVSEALKDTVVSCENVSCPSASASGMYEVGDVDHSFCIFECVSVCDSKGQLRQYYLTFHWERTGDACYEEIGELLHYGEYPYLCNPDDAPKCAPPPGSDLPTDTVYVAAEGGTGSECTKEHRCTLGTGLRKVKERGTIVFGDGKYQRFDTPRDQITFLAEHKHQAIIVNASASSPVHAINCQHSNITLSGLRASGEKTGGTNHGVVRAVDGCNNLTIQFMHVENSAGELINVGGTIKTNISGLVVEDSLIEGGGYGNDTAEGLYLGQFQGANRITDMVVRRNVFRDFGDNGIDCKPGCQNLEVYYNLFEKQRTNNGSISTTDGVVVVQGTNVNIHDNIFQDNDLSGEGGSSVARLTLKGARFENNVLTRNRHNGPIIRERAEGSGDPTVITGNTMCGNSNTTIAGGFSTADAKESPQSACDAEVARIMSQITL